MRAFRLQMQVSLDGFVAGESEWMERNWDDDLKNHVAKLAGPVGNILPGGKVAEESILYWSDAAQNPNNPEYQLAKKMNAPRKSFSQKH
ncbi:MAG TPA: hypothetical protein VKA49_22400 [Flavitalea sp.]|nr:hypothetical protein [Flavitalea sp.]